MTVNVPVNVPLPAPLLAQIEHILKDLCTNCKKKLPDMVDCWVVVGREYCSEECARKANSRR